VLPVRYELYFYILFRRNRSLKSSDSTLTQIKTVKNTFQKTSFVISIMQTNKLEEAIKLSIFHDKNASIIRNIYKPIT
jgi:hypothetical protein